MKGHNTPEQYKEFKKTQEVIIKAAQTDVSKTVAVKRMLEKAEKDMLLQQMLDDTKTIPENVRLQECKKECLEKLSQVESEEEKDKLSKQIDAIEDLEHLTG
jgi:GTPase SAR1 family protein